MLLAANLHPSWLVIVRSCDYNAPWQDTIGPIGVYIHDTSLMDKLFPAFNSSSIASEMVLVCGRRQQGHQVMWVDSAQWNHAVDAHFASIWTQLSRSCSGFWLLQPCSACANHCCN
ncbi:hypothetical protein H310_04823 [Aphanomyces invadans]|uniref:Uncharacterized protein n=1 Tax=Aphanomyces invadans TaxID=157072 RepID=A0A024UAN2_9STRA|nr:hypothetical protein H310_04823 [Aphanomyces invadans]ETW03329.1 hypothetical protein H310_04823 [Aphanomyces invadans]|eukprot:XP_008867558.1 hypothetical protein H310_04823 [Aphanomyces invadans]